MPTLLATVAAQPHADAVGDGERKLFCRRATVRLRDRSIAVTAHDRTAVRHLRQPAANPVLRYHDGDGDHNHSGDASTS